MRPRSIAAATAGALLLVAFTAWIFKFTLAEAVLLAPVIVLTAGATVAVVLLWTRVVLESLRRRR